MRVCCLLGISAITLAIAGCGNHDLRLALQPGDVRLLSHESEQTIHIEGKEGDAKHRHTARYRLEVQQRSADVATVKVTIEDMSTEMEMPNSWGAGGHIEQSIAVLARGLSFTIDMRTDGTVVAVDGADDVVDAITQSLQRPGLDLEKSRNVVLQQFSTESIQELFNNLFAYVPEDPVGPGDSWNATQLHATGMPFQSHVTYTLKSVEDNVAMVDYTATIEPYHTKATIALGMRYTFSGEEHGSLLVDANSGWVVSGDGALDLESRTDTTVTAVRGVDRTSSERNETSTPNSAQ